MRRIVLYLCAALALASCEQPVSELSGRWDVQQIAGASLGEGVDIWMEFDAAGASVSGFSGCNAFTTSASVFETSISFAQPAEQAGDCASEAAATDETRFLRVLPAVQRYILRGDSLELLQAPSGSETLIRLRRADGADQ
jgi:heat shock protein HslJ